MSSGICGHPFKFRQKTLIAGETIYVIGEHATLGGANAVLNKNEDIAELLAEWKSDLAALLARFDAYHDGEIDLDEWEAARHQAAEEVGRNHFSLRQQDGVHLMRKPAHGRPYLIANRKVEALTRHYRMWSAIHLVLLAASVGGIIFVTGKASLGG